MRVDYRAGQNYLLDMDTNGDDVDWENAILEMQQPDPV